MSQHTVVEKGQVWVTEYTGHEYKVVRIRNDGGTQMATLHGRIGDLELTCDFIRDRLSLKQ